MLQEGFERFAITLLAVTPSELNTIWTTQGAQAAVEHVRTLGLSEAATAQAEAFIENHDVDKDSFAAMAALFAGEYIGPSPHPTREQQDEIIAALQNLDGQ